MEMVAGVGWGSQNTVKTIWLTEGWHNNGQQGLGIQNQVLHSVMPKRTLYRMSLCTREGLTEATARGSFMTAAPRESLHVSCAWRMYGMLRQTSGVCWGNANQ